MSGVDAGRLHGEGLPFEDRGIEAEGFAVGLERRLRSRPRDK